MFHNTRVSAIAQSRKHNRARVTIFQTKEVRFGTSEQMYGVLFRNSSSFGDHLTFFPWLVRKFNFQPAFNFTTWQLQLYHQWYVYHSLRNAGLDRVSHPCQRSQTLLTGDVQAGRSKTFSRPAVNELQVSCLGKIGKYTMPEMGIRGCKGGHRPSNTK